MAKAPSEESKDQTSSEAPTPEVLQPKADEESKASEAASAAPDASKAAKRPRRGTYRPSHKATFIGLAVVVIVLAVNAAIIGVVIKSQSKNKSTLSTGEVTLSPSALDKVGVSRNTVGPAGIELQVNPNARFNGKVQVGGDVSIAGQLKLNSKFSATDASLAQLQAGNTSLNQLNVNGDTTSSSLNLRKDLSVVGLTRLDGPVTLGQLLTVNNNVNIAGNLSVGGTLTARSFHASSLASDSTLTIGGHVITSGSAPGVSAGGAVGSNGTVSISGNDAAGTVAVNAGSGAGGGIVANVSFRSSYSNTPHVVVTAVGSGVGSVYVNRSASGFSIGVTTLTTGGHAFDYIVMQ